MATGLGAMVEYRDTDGRTKAAMVVATPTSIDGRDERSGIKAPAEGHAHLRVFSFTGNTYDKRDVALGEGPGTFSVAPEMADAFSA